LGWPNVDAMLREMTEAQFAEWVAYYQIEPWGTLVTDQQMAVWKAMYSNAHRPKGKRARKPEEYLLYKERTLDASELYEDEDEE